MHLVMFLAVAVAGVRLLVAATTTVVANPLDSIVAGGLLALLVSTIKKVVDFVRYFQGGDMMSVVTQILAWLAGIGAAFIAANADLVNKIAVGSQPLATVNGASLILLGINLASGGGVLTDVIKAFDNTQSAAIPKLGAKAPAPPAA